MLFWYGGICLYGSHCQSTHLLEGQSQRVFCPCLDGSEPSLIHNGASLDRICSRTSNRHSFRLESGEFGGQVDALCSPSCCSFCSMAWQSIQQLRYTTNPHHSSLSEASRLVGRWIHTVSSSLFVASWTVPHTCGRVNQAGCRMSIAVLQLWVAQVPFHGRETCWLRILAII